MNFSHTKTTKRFAIKKQKGVRKIKHKADMLKQWLKKWEDILQKAEGMYKANRKDSKVLAGYIQEQRPIKKDKKKFRNNLQES